MRLLPSPRSGKRGGGGLGVVVWGGSRETANGCQRERALVNRELKRFDDGADVLSVGLGFWGETVDTRGLSPALRDLAPLGLATIFQEMRVCQRRSICSVSARPKGLQNSTGVRQKIKSSKADLLWVPAILLISFRSDSSAPSSCNTSHA